MSRVVEYRVRSVHPPSLKERFPDAGWTWLRGVTSAVRAALTSLAARARMDVLGRPTKVGATKSTEWKRYRAVFNRGGIFAQVTVDVRGGKA